MIQFTKEEGLRLLESANVLFKNTDLEWTTAQQDKDGTVKLYSGHPRDCECVIAVGKYEDHYAGWCNSLVSAA